MLCTIWYYLYNLKNMKNAHGGEKWQAFVPIYVAFMSPIYHFHFHFPYNQSYNVIETDFLHNFYNISYYFCFVTWIKKTSIFFNCKESVSGCCLASTWFFASFCLLLLTIVLLIKQYLIISLEIVKKPWIFFITFLELHSLV